MRISSSYFIMASLMPQIKCWGCFAWQYHFMLILDGTKNEVVISLCRAATISLTILSAAFYKDVAVTDGYGNHYTGKTSLSSCPKEFTDLCIHSSERAPLGTHRAPSRSWPRGPRKLWLAGLDSVNLPSVSEGKGTIWMSCKHRSRRLHWWCRTRSPLLTSD